MKKSILPSPPENFLGNSLRLPAIPDNLPAALKFYAQIHGLDVSDEAHRQLERQLVLNDLFYLFAFTLKRKDGINPWIFERCREVQREPNGYLDLWSRDHYKSSLITYALTIQDILRDPEDTICIFSHTKSNARKFLRQIKREFEENEDLKTLFDDVLWADPKNEAAQWSEDTGLVVKRTTNPKEPTLKASGLVDGQPTGDHFKKRIYDDTVTQESVNTPDQIAKTTEAWEMSISLGTKDSISRMIGTRYHLYDTYHEIMKRQAAKPRIYAATDNSKLDGRPVFFSEKIWATKLRILSRSNLASQYLQNPLADEDATFKVLWLRAYEVRPRTLNVYIMCDPSKGISAESDNTAMIVIGVSATGNKYLLDGYCHRMSLSKRWQYLRDLYYKWSAMPGVMEIAVGYERYGAQSDDEYFQERQRLENKIFPIEELNWTREGAGHQGKITRVSRLEPDFRNGRFYLPLAVWKDGRPHTWRVDDDPDSKTWQTIEWREVDGFTKLQAQAVDSGSEDLVCKCIKRYDEENKVYDLTEKFINEYMYFPFGEYRDALDAASRVYDMDPQFPVIVHKQSGEPPQFWDS